MSRVIEITTVFGKDVFVVREFRGVETISTLYNYDLVISSDSGYVDLEKLLNTRAVVTVNQGESQRGFAGVIIQARYLYADDLSGRVHTYAIKIVPPHWYLTQRVNSRIFQNKHVLDIISEVLKEHRVDLVAIVETDPESKPKPYTVQYNETDFNFISRLMEQEGYIYWFQFLNEDEFMHVADGQTLATSLGTIMTLPYYSNDDTVPPHTLYLQNWQEGNEVFSNKHESSDYDFERSGRPLEATHTIEQAGARQIEVYDPQGGYTDEQEGQKYAQISAESFAWLGRTIYLESNDASIATACDITVTSRDPLKNVRLRVVGASYQFYQSRSSSQSDDGDLLISTNLFAIPWGSVYRRPKLTPSPQAKGPMTARVVGTEDEQIYTDKYGRVKVQFHWDREGKNDENSSCWLRVASPWAGGGFGGVQIPRINDEVVVSFIGGNIDRPIVTGRFYNAENRTAWNYPDSATQMGTVTRSKHGDSSMANIMRLEDKPGHEMLAFQAQKDLKVNIKNDEDIKVMGTQTGYHGGTTDLTIGGKDDNIFKDKSSETNDADQIQTIMGTSQEDVTGPRSHTVGKNVDITINQGYRQTVRDGLASYAINGGLDRSIENDFARTATGPYSRNVTGSESVTVQNGHSSNVEGGTQSIQTRTMSIAATTGNTTTTSRGNTKFTTGTSFSVQTPATLEEKTPVYKEQHAQQINSTMVKSAGHSNLNSEYVMNMQNYASNTVVGNIKNELSNIKVQAVQNIEDKQTMKTDNFGVKIKKASSQINRLVVSNEMNALTLKN